MDCANELVGRNGEDERGPGGGRNVWAAEEEGCDDDDDELEDDDVPGAGDDDDDEGFCVELVNGGSCPKPDEQAAARFDRNKLLRLLR